MIFVKDFYCKSLFCAFLNSTIHLTKRALTQYILNIKVFYSYLWIIILLMHSFHVSLCLQKKMNKFREIYFISDFCFFKNHVNCGIFRIVHPFCIVTHYIVWFFNRQDFKFFIRTVSLVSILLIGLLI